MRGPAGPWSPLELAGLLFLVALASWVPWWVAAVLGYVVRLGPLGCVAWCGVVAGGGALLLSRGAR